MLMHEGRGKEMRAIKEKRDTVPKSNLQKGKRTTRNLSGHTQSCSQPQSTVSGTGASQLSGEGGSPHQGPRSPAHHAFSAGPLPSWPSVGTEGTALSPGLRRGELGEGVLEKKETSARGPEQKSPPCHPASSHTCRSSPVPSRNIHVPANLMALHHFSPTSQPSLYP